MASAQRTLDMRRSVRQCSECGQRFSADAAFCPFDGAKLEGATWDPSDDELLGKVIDGRYHVDAVLGEGGMGKVYRVRHTSLDRMFAMKLLRKDLARDAELAARFILEARTTASIRHPQVVSISDFGMLPDGETPYFVMELLTGETLGQVIRAGGPLPAARAVGIIRHIAGALGAAHAANVVHRDLKPENVFLVGGMQGGAVSDDLRVVDFGAAKVMGASRLTKAGIVFGTPHYMSPEQASGAAVDHRADIYALGIIMYEMFTGKVPFEADTYMGVLTQHMFVQPIPPSQVCAAAKGLGALEGITLRALEKKPEDRYASMEELAADLGRVVRFSNGRFEVATDLGRPSRPPRSVRYKMADELEPPTLEEMRVAIDSMAPPKNTSPWMWIAGAVVAAGVVCAVAFALTRGPGSSRSASPRSARSGATGSALPATAAAPFPAVSASPPSTASTMKAVTLRATPPAEVSQGARVFGTTPVDVSVDPSAAPAHYTLTSTGYTDADVAVDGTKSEVAVELHRQGGGHTGGQTGAQTGSQTSRGSSGTTPQTWQGPTSSPGNTLPNPFKH